MIKEIMDYENEAVTDMIIETIEIKDKEENILGYAYKYKSGMLMMATNKGSAIIVKEDAPMMDARSNEEEGSIS